MRHSIERLIMKALEVAVHDGVLALAAIPSPPPVERPRDPSHGDWATAVALRFARELGRSPRDIAQVIVEHIAPSPSVASIEIAGPGFINFRLSNEALQGVIRDAREQGAGFGTAPVGQGRTLNIEFVSANPTGPLHVGHGRWAALGNALANVCAHAGWHVTREFYINDAGNQMDVFGQSVALRYRELLGEDITMPEDCYGGAYVRDIAQQILDEEGDVWRAATDDVQRAHFRERGYQLMLARMQALCERIGVHFDTWFSERTLYEKNANGGGAVTTTATPDAPASAPVPAPGAPSDRTPSAPTSAIEDMLATLDAGGYLYDKDGATWFRTTDFNDDKDRVLIKADGSYTYFAPDIAYHLSKYRRGSEFLVNIWGADHHGYIPRMQAACEALGHGGTLQIVLGQLVNLYRNGEAVRMSKRTGEMISFEELIEEVGPDATKYLMLSRSTDQPIDFDIEAAKKQDATNPVYYVQYAHARICSLLRKAAGQTKETKGDGSFVLAAEAKAAEGNGSPASVPAPAIIPAPPIPPAPPALSHDAPDLSLLTDPAELELARVFMQFEEVVEGAARDLAPFRLTHYAEELATSFHSFYTRCQVIGDDEALTKARLYLADATRSVLALVLALLGVSAPEQM